jgi:hypothetical protein
MIIQIRRSCLTNYGTGERNISRTLQRTARRNSSLVGLTDLTILNIRRNNNMGKKISEVDVTWASIEKYYNYNTITWSVDNNGIPRYTLFDKDYNKIDVDVTKCW